MKFQKKNSVLQTILVISDIHLGAGSVIAGRKNYLEDFHNDREFIDFIEYYSQGEYATAKVELVINGDFFDLLAVPFVPYFDDSFFSEEASLKKLDMILYAHHDLMKSLNQFLYAENKTIKYIIGNHDAELMLPSLQKRVIEFFDTQIREKFSFVLNQQGEYSPAPRVIIKHGHQIESANHQGEKASVIEDQNGKKYFIPPWGSYFVTRVLNKFKQERPYANTVRPIRHFIINGLIYDTIFILRFLATSLFYFFMIRILFLYKSRRGLKPFLQMLKDDLILFLDHDDLPDHLLGTHPHASLLIIGHTHKPEFYSHINGSVFINTGTWIKMHNLELGRRREEILLTYAQIDLLEKNESIPAQRPLDLMDVNLHIWQGVQTRPYKSYF